MYFMGTEARSWRNHFGGEEKRSTMSERTDSAWPIDPDGEAGSNSMRRFDMAILSKFEPKSAFPMTTETFLDRHGEKPVRFDHRTVLSVEAVFESVEVDSFETKTEFHAAIGDAIRSADLWTYRPGSS